jgi:hypothetical protein
MNIFIYISSLFLKLCKNGDSLSFSHGCESIPSRIPKQCLNQNNSRVWKTTNQSQNQSQSQQINKAMEKSGFKPLPLLLPLDKLQGDSFLLGLIPYRSGSMHRFYRVSRKI